MKQAPPYRGTCTQWKAARCGVPPASKTVYSGKQDSTQTVITSLTLSLNLTPSGRTASQLLRVLDAHPSIHATSGWPAALGNITGPSRHFLPKREYLKMGMI
ncbi:unnamed protein product, partial [Gulo gulo]